MNEKSRQDFIDLLNRSNPKQRKTSMQSVEGKVSADGVTYIREEINTVTPDMTARQVVFLSSRECDCGQVLGQDNPLKGKCQHPGCKHFVCRACCRTCGRCGMTVCYRHSRQVSGVYYCKRCYPLRLLIQIFKWFFDIEKEKK